MSNSTGDEHGSSLGNKVKGAWNTFEGFGDSLRGEAMDFADSATGTSGHHTETDMGRQKTQAGMAEMKGGGYSGTAPQTTGTTVTSTTGTHSGPPREGITSRGQYPTSGTTATSTTGTHPVPPREGIPSGGQYPTSGTTVISTTGTHSVPPREGIYSKGQDSTSGTYIGR